MSADYKYSLLIKKHCLQDTFKENIITFVTERHFISCTYVKPENSGNTCLVVQM